MAEGSHTGSERQGAGHSDREDGMGRCGRKPLAGCSLERGDTTPKGDGAGAKRSFVPAAVDDREESRAAFHYHHIVDSVTEHIWNWIA